MDERSFRFEDCLNQMAVIRATFETLEYFPDDEPTRSDLLEIVETTRFELGEWIYAFTWHVETHPEEFDVDWNEFRDYVLELAVRGYPGRSIDSMMRGNWFGESRYYLDLAADLTSEELQSMDDISFVVRMLQRLHARITDRASFIDRPTFDRKVFQPYIALMFVSYATSNPLRYLRPPQ